MKLLFTLEGLTSSLRIFDDHIVGEKTGSFALEGRNNFEASIKEISLVKLDEGSLLINGCFEIYVNAEVSKRYNFKLPTQIRFYSTKKNIQACKRAVALIEYLRKNPYDEQEVKKILSMELGEVEKKTIKKSQIKSFLIGIVLVPVLTFFIIQAVNTSKTANNKSNLVNNDWVIEFGGRIVKAYKFNTDGTFNYSEEINGTYTEMGNWTLMSDGKIALTNIVTTQGGTVGNYFAYIKDSEHLESGENHFHHK